MIKCIHHYYRIVAVYRDSGSTVNYANYGRAREVTRWSDILQEDMDRIVQANDKVTDDLKEQLNSVYSTSKFVCIMILAITAAVIIFVVITIIMTVIIPLRRMNNEQGEDLLLWLTRYGVLRNPVKIQRIISRELMKWWWNQYRGLSIRLIK